MNALPYSALAREFIASVVRTKPELAVFDCDGTLWANDAGEGFFSWELKQGLVPDEIVRWARPRYADYKAGKVSEEQMCGEMVTMHAGLREDVVQRAASRYFEEVFIGNVFIEMHALVRQLRESGKDVWVVSSTNEWVIRAAMPHFGIPPEKILAAAVQIEDGIITDRLTRVPTGDGKPKVIREVIGRGPDAAFGNSIWDADMLEISGHAFVINPTAQLEKRGRERKWPIYFPDLIARR